MNEIEEEQLRMEIQRGKGLVEFGSRSRRIKRRIFAMNFTQMIDGQNTSIKSDKNKKL